jgi:hypothetical protein
MTTNPIRARIFGLHKLAGRCVTALLQLHYFCCCADGHKHGQAALARLRAAVAKSPPLPLNPDPFCREHSVKVCGMRAASAHAAAFALAKQTWDALQQTTLVAETASEHQDKQGTPYTRITFAVRRQPASRASWSFDRWRQLCEILKSQPEPEEDWFQAELELECTLAIRRS